MRFFFLELAREMLIRRSAPRTADFWGLSPFSPRWDPGGGAKGNHPTSTHLFGAVCSATAPFPLRPLSPVVPLRFYPHNFESIDFRMIRSPHRLPAFSSGAQAFQIPEPKRCYSYRGALPFLIPEPIDFRLIRSRSPSAFFQGSSTLPNT